MKYKKILLLDGISHDVYKGSKIRRGIFPSLTMPTLAAPLVKEGFDVKILDLFVKENPEQVLKDTLKRFDPDIVCLSFTTPAFPSTIRLAEDIKAFNKDILIIGGGSHATALPREVLKESKIDIIVKNEGELGLLEIAKGKPLNEILGIVYKEHGVIKETKDRPFINELDALSYPSWELIDLKEYKKSPYHKSFYKKHPIGPIETSRGCPYYNSCFYCNPKFGTTFRAKSPTRVVEEMKFYKEQGFKEIYICDDNFSQDLERAKKICELIKKENLDLSWSLTNGIRVDRVDKEFLTKAKESGCYNVAFGVETGTQHMLDRLGKKTRISQVEDAFKIAKELGLNRTALCVFGNPGETARTMQATIDLVKKLDPTFARVAVLVPFPGTPIFKLWKEQGYITNFNWEDYRFHNTNNPVYEHPEIDLDLVYKYYKKFYLSFYMRPSFMAKRLFKGIKQEHLLSDIMYFLSYFIG